jgi:hypothetical protein
VNRPVRHRHYAGLSDVPPPTARTYLGRYTVHVTCLKCDHKITLDLEALVKGRHADTPLIELPLKCTACLGRRFHISVEYVDQFMPGRAQPKGEEEGP